MCQQTAVSPRRTVALDAPNQSPLPLPPTSLLGRKRPRTSSLNTNSTRPVDIVVSEDESGPPPTKPRRSVAFSGNICIIGKSATQQEDVTSMWFGHKELGVFKNQARDFVLGRSSETETRGYERYNVVTAKKKSMTRKVTLLACSQKGLSPEDVATIVHKSTRWAVNDAFRTGCQDYCVVYRPELTAACSLMGKRFRSHNIDADDASKRNVRRRTAAH